MNWWTDELRDWEIEELRNLRGADFPEQVLIRTFGWAFEKLRILESVEVLAWLENAVHEILKILWKSLIFHEIQNIQWGSSIFYEIVKIQSNFLDLVWIS